MIYPPHADIMQNHKYLQTVSIRVLRCQWGIQAVAQYKLTHQGHYLSAQKSARRAVPNSLSEAWRPRRSGRQAILRQEQLHYHHDRALTEARAVAAGILSTRPALRHCEADVDLPRLQTTKTLVSQ